jgi:hypothetical protein
MTLNEKNRDREIGLELKRLRESFHAEAATDQSRKADSEAVQALLAERGQMRRRIETRLRRA